MKIESFKNIEVKAGSRHYHIVVGDCQLSKCGHLLREYLPDGKIGIVGDTNSLRLFGERVHQSLKEHGWVSTEYDVLAGESSKSMDMYAKLVSRVIHDGFGRNDTLIALGGGVVGDLAGFVAGTVHRGMNFVQIPTTVMAQVDSSIGGKTGVNLPYGKNLVGVFYQPRLVITDPSLLYSLPEREVKSGYIEILKYSLINDKDFFEWLENNTKNILDLDITALEYAIFKSCQHKVNIVEQDERESNIRGLLNFGHTFGHAIEQLAGYGGKVIHGEAVAAGLYLAHSFSEFLGLAPQGDLKKLEEHYKKIGINCLNSWDILKNTSIDHLINLFERDKKVKNSALTFVLTKGIGKAFIYEGVERKALKDFLVAFKQGL